MEKIEIMMLTPNRQSKKTFVPAWWLRGPHLQTIWPALCRRPLKTLTAQTERFELSDGDFVDLAWVGQGSGPIVLVLHGLEGSLDSLYVQGMLNCIQQAGWRGVLMHFRGCSGEDNRHARSYHSGDTADVAEVVRALHAREPNVSLAAVGFSLGGNVLLKWLGETAEKNLLQAAVAISVPFELAKACQRMQRGFSWVYQWRFLRLLSKRMQKKFQQRPEMIALARVKKMKTLCEFDDHITAPLHGFVNAADYYQRASSRAFLKTIQVPTLLLQAKDDPFMTPDVLPEPHELSATTLLELSEQGGHVGFVAGKLPWRAHYWLEQRVPEFLAPFLAKE